MSEAWIGEDSEVKAHPDQVSADLGADTAILQTGAGVYYTLNDVGGQIWRRAQEWVKVASLVDSLISVYDIDRETLAHDTISLLEDLRRHDLIEVKP